MNKEFIEQLIKEVKENYEPSEIGELTLWLDGLLNSEVCEAEKLLSEVKE